MFIHARSKRKRRVIIIIITGIARGGNGGSWGIFVELLTKEVDKSPGPCRIGESC